MLFVRTLTIILLFFSQPVTACLNMYHVSESGVETHGHLDGYQFQFVRVNNAEVINNYKAVSAWLKRKYDPTYYSDYGAILLKAGYYKEGLRILLQVNKELPGAYNVIANLGTAYELNGRNDSALYWIKQALKLDQNSHRGSEWIHVRILEAKINEKNTPGWMKANRFIPQSILTGKSLNAIVSGLEYQLHERVPFSPAPDPYMAWMLEEFGDYIMKKVSVSEAWKLYAVAKVYSPVFSLQLEDKIIRARSLTETYRKQRKKGVDTSRWPTDKSVDAMVTSFRNHRVGKIPEIIPVFYH